MRQQGQPGPTAPATQPLRLDDAVLDRVTGGTDGGTADPEIEQLNRLNGLPPGRLFNLLRPT